jgi:hypothetical protein
MVFMGGHHGRSHCCPKKNNATCLMFAKEHLDVPKYSELFGRKEHITLCVERKRHSTPTSKPHPNCKVWWREHHDLGLLCCNSLLSSMEKFIPKFIKTFGRRM